VSDNINRRDFCLTGRNNLKWFLDILLQFFLSTNRSHLTVITLRGFQCFKLNVVFPQVRLNLWWTGPKLALSHTLNYSHIHILSHIRTYTHSYTHTHTPSLTHTHTHTLTHSVLGKSLFCQNLSFACSAAHTTRTLHWFRPFSLKNFLKTVS
jgi:hypothetical protein